MNKQQAAISISNLTVAYNDKPVLWDITCDISFGSLLAVVGPNGAGKTTLIKAILGLIKPTAGTVIAQNKNGNEIAYVPQRCSVDWDFPATVLDVVLMGRYKHIGWLKWPRKDDYEKARMALSLVNMHAFEDQPIGELSGGQQQRVFLARALVQEASIYLLDEPFVGVDLPSEKTMMQILKKLRDEGKTVVIVHHDLQTLADYFDTVLLLNSKKVAFGSVEHVLRPEYICNTYGERNVFVPNL